MLQTQTKKLKLETDIKQELKLYFMITRPVAVNVSNEFVQPILAYNLESAVREARKNIPSNFSLVYHGQVISVKEFLSKIHLGKEKVLLEHKVKTSSKKQFVWDLMLTADKFLKDEKDKKALKRLIKKIK